MKTETAEITKLTAENADEYIILAGAEKTVSNLSKTVYLAAGQKASDYVSVTVTAAEYAELEAAYEKSFK